MTSDLQDHRVHAEWQLPSIMMEKLAQRPNSWGKHQTKVFRVFLLAIQSHISIFALKFIFSNSCNPLQIYSALVYTVKEKGRKPDRNLTLFTTV
jgi:hypothetical protein